MVRKDRYAKSNVQKLRHEIKPDIMLFTENKMLPTFKSVPTKMPPRICSFPNVKPTMMQLSKREKKRTLSFLQSPSHGFYNTIQEKRKEKMFNSSRESFPISTVVLCSDAPEEQKMKTTNNEDLLIAPMYQSFFCNLITPDLCKNGNRKEDVNVKDKLYTSYSEDMMKIVNHKSEMRLLQVYHPKICYLCCSREKKRDIKGSMSAIRYSRSTQCVFDIKNNNSYLHISQSKRNNDQRYDVKCSFEDINCIGMPEKRSWLIKTSEGKENKRCMEDGCDCKIKYSWQIIGTSSQTSKVLLHNDLEENQSQFSNHNDKSSTYKCEIKYSWQIVGTGTQVALQNSNDTDYWTGVIFSPSIHRNRKSFIDEENKKTCNEIDWCKLQGCKKKCIILNNQCIQTLAEKKTQTDILDCNVKYSWQNLILRHL
ncbi:uncharacterized protein LOC118447438 [Vespa mandarinia]|uniref:uncharacterized protein LOC118447438 n=1 Tax=Vespa mandarinia TaxID=7446 RepID=UPI001607DB68|nr:uncharacterized protein LOC118447438 [Vespa mandarinia]